MISYIFLMRIKKCQIFMRHETFRAICPDATLQKVSLFHFATKEDCFKALNYYTLDPVPLDLNNKLLKSNLFSKKTISNARMIYIHSFLHST
jgi:hypothetical protein